MKSNPSVHEFFKRFGLQLIKYSIMPEKIKLIGKLKDGQKLIGVLDDYDSDRCILISKDGSKVQLSMFNTLEQALDAGDYENEIIEIERTGNEYEISSYGTDDWDEIKADEKAKS